MIIKKKNRMLVKMARCMLHGGNIDLRLRDKIIAYAFYIINYSPTRALNTMNILKHMNIMYI